MSKYLSYNTPGDEIRALRERVAKLERAQQSQFGGAVLAGGGGATKVYGMSGTISYEMFPRYGKFPVLDFVLDAPATVVVTATVIQSYVFTPSPPNDYNILDWLKPDIWPYDEDYAIVGPLAPLMHLQTLGSLDEPQHAHATGGLTYIHSFSAAGEVSAGVQVHWPSPYPNEYVPLNLSVTAVVGEYTGESNVEFEPLGV